MQVSDIKYDYSLEDPGAFQAELDNYGDSGPARIKGALDILRCWSGNFPDKTVSPHLLHTLRFVVQSEVNRLDFNAPDIVAEQVLMVMVGALQSQKDAQNDAVWDIAAKSIDVIIGNVPRIDRPKLVAPVIGACLLLVIPAAYFFMQRNEAAAITPALSSLPVLSEQKPMVPSPYVPSHLYSMKQNMDNAVCQFPQAAMLPEEERSAFVAFITKGEISLAELTNLQAALSKVDCQYRPLTITAETDGTKQK